MTQGIKPDYNGVLGGFEYTHDIDIEDSTQFINKLVEKEGLVKGDVIGSCGVSRLRVRCWEDTRTSV